jgi:hypothetical protein
MMRIRLDDGYGYPCHSRGTWKVYAAVLFVELPKSTTDVVPIEESENYFIRGRQMSALYGNNVARAHTGHGSVSMSDAARTACA